jgi:glycosyltransferase involved in cell wall biosynthesis
VKITAIVLTFNESLHLDRCLESLKTVVSDVWVVDCFSTDETLEIARRHGACVVQNQWVNYATQFNWALSQLPASTDWVLRIDADEYLTPALIAEMERQLPTLDTEVNGVYCGRRMTFQGRLIRHGGIFPVRVLRLFRRGYGQCENRWMDEHIKVTGPTADLREELVDDNLNSLTWWTEKHNKYASREAIDLLNLEFGFMPRDTVANIRTGKQDGVKRWLKEEVYARLPGGFRALIYFVYRYVIRLGFLDGKEGTAFHFLQGYWYRYLVDAKVTEVKRYMRNHSVTADQAISKVLGISLDIR